jgi:hypothetical protein
LIGIPFTYNHIGKEEQGRKEEKIKEKSLHMPPRVKEFA